MYTIIWTKNGHDVWDRLETGKDVENLLKEIEADPEASPLEDVWVFGPDADRYAVTGSTFRCDTFDD